MKVSDKTSVSMPIKNMIGIVVAVAMGVFAYTEVTARLTSLETSRELFQADLLKKSEQKPTDQEQFMLIEHLAGQLEKLTKNIETGKAPYDQQQKLTLDFYKQRIEKLEEQIDKLKDKVVNGKH